MRPRSLLIGRRRNAAPHSLIASTDNVSAIAYRWGISHLGRFAGAYRDRFDELPSETAARR